MTETRKKEIFSHLGDSEIAVKKIVEGVTEALFQKKPNDTSWSMAELVEHIIMVEKGVLGTIQKIGATAPAEAVVTSFEDEKIIRLTGNRGTKVDAPKYFIPKGIFTTKEMALQAFRAHRAEIEDFISTTTLPLENIGFPHFIFGVLNGENWFVFMAGHCNRHADQMSEIK